MCIVTCTVVNSVIILFISTFFTLFVLVFRKQRGKSIDWPSPILATTGLHTVAFPFWNFLALTQHFFESTLKRQGGYCITVTKRNCSAQQQMNSRMSWVSSIYCIFFNKRLFRANACLHQSVNLESGKGKGYITL